jgi:hypothetical protein
MVDMKTRGEMFGSSRRSYAAASRSPFCGPSRRWPKKRRREEERSVGGKALYDRGCFLKIAYSGAYNHPFILNFA